MPCRSRLHLLSAFTTGKFPPDGFSPSLLPGLFFMELIMTDLRHLENHREEEDAGWKDLLVGVLGMLAVVAVFWLTWMVLPGASTVDGVLQIERPDHFETYVGARE